MKRRKKDAGLSCVQRLGISPARTTKTLRSDLEYRFGKEQVQTFLQELPKKRGTDFFDYKSQEKYRALSRAYTGALDAGVIRESINYLDAHRNAVGKEILEIGCDQGLFTAALAMTFPDSHITTIDRSAAALQATAELLQELGLSNVTLLHASAQEYLGAAGDEGETKEDGTGSGTAEDSRTFDTIITMRALLENLDTSLSLRDYQPLEVQLDTVYLPMVEDYAAVLSQAAHEGSTLVSLLDAGPSALQAAWMMVLEGLGWSIEDDSCRQLTCSYPDASVPLQALVAHATPVLFAQRDAAHLTDSTDTGDEQQALSDEALTDRMTRAYTLWQDGLELGSALTSLTYEGWEAEAVCFSVVDGLISGIGIYDAKTGEQLGKYAIYSEAGNDQNILFYRGYRRNISVMNADISTLEEGKAFLQRIHDRAEPSLPAELRSRSRTRIAWLRRDPETDEELPVEEKVEKTMEEPKS